MRMGAVFVPVHICISTDAEPEAVDRGSAELNCTH